MIADGGEHVTNELLSRVQQSVTARLSEIQTEIEERRQQELAQLDLKADARSATAASEIEELQDERQSRTSRARASMVENRQELQALQPLLFLGEPRYRELKARYGTALPAKGWLASTRRRAGGWACHQAPPGCAGRRWSRSRLSA